MKKLIILSLILISMSLPIVLSSTDYDWTAASVLPEYNGDINDPGVCVIAKGDGYWVVRINGNLYFFRPNK